MVVNVDLVVPAVISSELWNIQCLNGYEKNRDEYLATMTISVGQIMNYAARMKSWDLGRVVINFGSEDAEHYLQSRPDIFRRKEGCPQLYSVLRPQDRNREQRITGIIADFVSKINYSPYVMRTVGLLRE